MELRDVGVLLAVGLVLALPAREFSQSIERRYLDLFQSLQRERGGGRIVLVDTPAGADARQLAELIEVAAALGAAQIASVAPARAPLSESDRQQLEALAALEASTNRPGAMPPDDAQRNLLGRLARLRERVAGAQSLVAAANAARNVFVALPLEPGGAALPADCARHAVVPRDGSAPAIAADAPGLGPLPDGLCRVVAGAGHVDYRPDADGVVRRTRLLVDAGGARLPALVASVAAAALGPERSRPEFDAAGSLRVGSTRFPAASRFVTFGHGRVAGVAPHPVLAARDLLAGRLPPGSLQGRIVLIGEAAPAPSAANAPPVLRLVANSLSDLLDGRNVIRRDDLRALEPVLLLLCLLLPLALAGIGQPLRRGALVVAAAGSLVGTQAYLVVLHGLWLPLVTPALALLLGAGALHLLRGFGSPGVAPVVAEPAVRAEPALEPQAADPEQDSLDLQFALLRQEPNTAKTRDELYALAVRYARARQMAEAERVLRFLATLDPHHRNVQQKLAGLSGLRSRLPEATAPPATPVPAPTPDGDQGDRRQGDRRSADRRKGGRRLSDQFAGDAAPTLARLGRYNLLRQLGFGAMAHVYLAEDPLMRRQVAIKTLALAEEFADEDLVAAREQFAREAQAAGCLQHPNIVKVYDFGEEEGLSYIVMEYFPGKPTTAFIAPDKLLPAKWVMELVAQAADALHYAHGQNVVHRDIKPANLMYDLGGDILKIADFGIARLTDTKRTRSGIVMGTPTYMAPERFTGDTIDGRADLYALGVTAYQLLTGSVPFRALSIPLLIEQITGRQHEPVTSIRTDLPPAIDDIIGQALAKDPAQRFADGRAMAAALRACGRALAA